MMPPFVIVQIDRGDGYFFKMAVACLRTLKTFSVCFFHVGSFAFAGIAYKLKKTNDSIEKIKQIAHFSTKI